MGRGERGFTLVELMIAITLSLFIIGVLGLLFVSSSRAAREIDQTNRLIENGQYALSVLSDDLEHAGFYGFFDPITAGGNVGEFPTDLPDPCATEVSDLSEDFLIHLQGYDNLAEDDDGPACIPNAKVGSDIVVVRRVEGCAVCPGGGGGCGPITDACAAYEVGSHYFQASQCQGADQLDGGELSNFVSLSDTVADLDRTARDCSTPAEARRFMVHIYYVVDDYRGQNPALVRAELHGDGFTVVPIAEGIENLQVEFGVDSPADPDGVPDLFTSNLNTCTGLGSIGGEEDASECTVEALISELKNVVSARVQLLVRTTGGISVGHVDRKEIILGNEVIPAANDSYKRRVHQALVRINNPSMRRE